MAGGAAHQWKPLIMADLSLPQSLPLALKLRRWPSLQPRHPAREVKKRLPAKNLGRAIPPFLVTGPG